MAGSSGSPFAIRVVRFQDAEVAPSPKEIQVGSESLLLSESNNSLSLETQPPTVPDDGKDHPELG